MRTSVGFAVGSVFGLMLSGCARAALKSAGAPAAPAYSTATSPVNQSAAADGFEERLSNQAQSGEPAASPAASPGPGAPRAPAMAETEPRLDIEAHLGLLVPSVATARGQLRRQAVARGATITSDVSEDLQGQREVKLTIRVPIGTNDAFMTDLENLGQVTDRQITVKDVGREYHDSEIVLHNLERTLARYEEILQKAQSVEEILKIEAELSRIRGEIDRVKGELSYLADRSARATVFVLLRENVQQVARTPARVAKFFPGVRALALTEFRGDSQTRSTFGGGLVAGAGRALSVELDALKRLDSSSNRFDAVLAALGGDAYSDFLGGGKRRFLNPYLGLRVGYASLSSHGHFATGATLGVELWKTDYATVDCDLRALGLFGSSGAELGLQPTLGAIVAF